MDERQYKVTKARIEEFKLVIHELKKMTPSKMPNDQLRHQAHLDILENQLEKFYDEIEEYEKQFNNKSSKLDSEEE